MLLFKCCTFSHSCTPHNVLCVCCAESDCIVAMLTIREGSPVSCVVNAISV